MFGVIVSGRPVLTEGQTISPTQSAFSLPATPRFNHLVVFLHPGAAFPPDAAAAVYIRLTPTSDFRLLGAIAADKPSAVFKINGNDSSPTGGGAGASADVDAMVDDASGPTPTPGANDVVMLGISVEPAAQVAAALAAQKAGTAGGSAGQQMAVYRPPPARVATKVLAQRIVTNLFNFLASFTSGGAGGQEVVPLKSVQDWWGKFERRIEQDPGFLEREEGN
ncbi:DUF775-domain-containing protein [Eremomyces bilateralis CBS 781.70]|uniref:DUF775-domain-containing protein n=1 Tax=Eremomyces bilateralis CBS 781.70 TaxID=1392243 RepID=A0A6G1GGS8_9PEZI|nr:DUF775-domain-containing protein [Eremomyces bilateralis CBS 781.70]KAF1817253.1 DUF775-domain-containing protein [Eremomyces bilateralis CBS 781.70]